jgi:hypothetical protein
MAAVLRFAADLKAAGQRPGGLVIAIKAVMERRSKAEIHASDMLEATVECRWQ